MFGLETIQGLFARSLDSDDGAASRPCILVADDEPDVRRLLRRVLTKQGYQVTEVSDGMTLRTYLEAAFAGREGFRIPDLLLSDIHMPGLNGIEVLETLPAAAWRIPTVVITGLEPDMVREDTRRAGALYMLTKPFSIKDLKALVGRLLGREGE